MGIKEKEQRKKYEDGVAKKSFDEELQRKAFNDIMKRISDELKDFLNIGFYHGLYDTVKDSIVGIWNMLANPAQTYQALKHALSNPLQTIQAVGKAIADDYIPINRQ